MLAPKIHLKYGFFNQNCLDSLEDLNEYNVSQKLNEIINKTISKLNEPKK